MRGRVVLEGLSLSDLSDIALLHIFDAALDENGEATSRQVAELLDLETEHPTQNVGIRLSWLARYGVLVYESGKWKWTTKGERAFRASLGKRGADALDSADEMAMLAAMHHIGARLGAMDETARNLVRREWTHAYGQIRR